MSNVEVLNWHQKNALKKDAREVIRLFLRLRNTVAQQSSLLLLHSGGLETFQPLTWGYLLCNSVPEVSMVQR
jgi:hypothetical protein